MQKVVIVVPTYNEKDNIDKTLTISLEEFGGIDGYDMNILVVDGNSPDGTADIVKGFTEKYKNVHLLRKEKGGLGGDYIAGMKYAMHKLNADFVGEMDADLQHNPSDVSRFLQEISKGADVVVGTRFIQDGSIPEEWGIHRKFLSSVGNVYARFMTGMWSIHDLTSGFRITRVKNFLDTVKLDSLYSKRFAYKMELYYRLYKLGARVVEVPIHFRERAQGQSKIQVFSNLNSNDWLDSYIVVTKIFLERLGLLRFQRFFRVATIGVLGGGVQYVVYTILRLLTLLSPQMSTAISAEAAILSNFVLNYHWAFKDRKNGDHWLKRLVIFNVTSLGSPVIQVITVGLGVRLFGEGLVFEWIYLAVGMWVGLIWNYVFYSRVVWRNR